MYYLKKHKKGNPFTIIFAKRNIDKTANGDIGRAPIPVFQALSATAGVATLAETAGFTKANNGMNSLFGKADKLLEKANIQGSSKNICKAAGDMVNPLLCVASAMRIMKDEDKGSAIIEEGLAMSSMFAGEAVVKHLRDKTIPNAIKKASAASLKAELNSCKTAVKSMNLKSLKSAIAGASGNKMVKLGGSVLGDLAVVAVSILCFDLGKKIGKKITGREEEKQVGIVKSIMKQPMQPLVKSLTVKA